MFLCSCTSMRLNNHSSTTTYQYVAGSLIKEYPMSYESAWESVNAALENLKLSLTFSQKEAGKGAISARDYNGTQVSIILMRKGGNITSIAVKGGFLSKCYDAERLHMEIANVVSD